jgi:hypothetical protein
MAFNIQPSNATSQAYPVYSPIYYQTAITLAPTATTTSIMQARVKITFNGSTLTNPVTSQDVELIYTPTSTIANVSTFDIDVHSILSDYMDNTRSLPSSFLNSTDISEDCTNFYANIGITVKYYYIDNSTGYDVLTYSSSTDDTSNTIFVVDAIVQPNQLPQLGFILSGTQPNYVTMSPTTPFLTVAPDGLEVRANDRAFLSFISDETARSSAVVQIIWTNKNGTTQSGQYTAIPGMASTDRKVIAVGVGPLQIETFSTDIGFGGGATFIAADVAYYNVRILDTTGSSTPAGDYLTRARTYNLTSNSLLCGGAEDEATIRMHFLTELGACDSITLVGKLERRQEVKSKTVQSARSTVFNFEDVSNRKYEQQVLERYVFKGAEYFSNTELQWLRQMLASAFVTIDKTIGGTVYHIPVVIKDKKQVVFDTEEDNNLEFEYTLNYNLQTRR